MLFSVQMEGRKEGFKPQNISSSIHKFPGLWLLHLEMAVLCLACSRGYLQYMHSENTPIALLAQWLSGVSRLITEQTDLILMPCLQLFSPELLSTERSSCEPTDTEWSWCLAGHSHSISPSPCLPFIRLFRQRQMFVRMRHNIILH